MKNLMSPEHQEKQMRELALEHLDTSKIDSVKEPKILVDITYEQGWTKLEAEETDVGSRVICVKLTP